MMSTDGRKDGARVGVGGWWVDESDRNLWEAKELPSRRRQFVIPNFLLPRRD
jgi:hypothetical protein